MSEFIIRKLQEKDRAALIEILHLADPHGEGHPAPELIYKRWGEYYLKESAENCFIAALPESDRPVGVILCAPDTPMYQRHFNQTYFRGILNALNRVERDCPGTIMKHRMTYYRRREGRILNWIHPFKMRQIYKKFPAHLHINIHPDYQRKGLGHILVNRLISHLREEGIGGLHLIVASDNLKGIGFYRKYGFREVLKIFPAGKSGIIYGIETAEKR